MGKPVTMRLGAANKHRLSHYISINDVLYYRLTERGGCMDKKQPPIATKLIFQQFQDGFLVFQNQVQCCLVFKDGILVVGDGVLV